MVVPVWGRAANGARIDKPSRRSSKTCIKTRGCPTTPHRVRQRGAFAVPFPLAILILLLIPGTVQGQAADDKTEDVQRLLKEATRLVELGDTARAIDSLTRATRLAPSLADAHYRRGTLLSRSAGTGPPDMIQRRSANAALERALRLDQKNPWIILELGRLRLKQGFGRLEASLFFKRALKAASERGDPKVVGEIEAELGDIHRRRADAVVGRRIITGGTARFDPHEAMGNPHYARDFLFSQSSEIPDAGELDLRLAEEHYRGGVSAWPGHEGSTSGLLGILYESVRYEEFIEVARNFLRTVPDNFRAHLFYGLGLWRANRPADAARSFAKALELMPPIDRAQLDDLSIILRRKEAERYQELSSAERAEFERIYWSANDPLRLTAENEHWLEHLARVAFADVRYSAPDIRVRGWQTDRGVIYIRYGPPPVMATFAPTTVQMGSSFSDNDNIGKVTTVWYYPERNMRFVFFGPPGYNFARFAGEFQAYAEDARYAVPVRYDNVPVNDALDSVPVQAVAFKPRPDTGAAAPAGAELVLYAALPIRDMAAGIDLANGPLESGFFITDGFEREIIARRNTETVTFAAERQVETRTFAATVRPGRYRYRVEALQPTTRRAARGMAAVNVPGFDRPSLLLSDVVLADRVVPRREVAAHRLDFFLDPNAAMRYAPGQPVGLYWEIYNLTADTLGAVKYQVDVVVRVQALERRGFGARIIGGLADAVGLSAQGKDQVTVHYAADESLAGRDRIPAWLSLDLQGGPNGTYTIELTVTDLRSGQTATQVKTFAISAIGTGDR